MSNTTLIILLLKGKNHTTLQIEIKTKHWMYISNNSEPFLQPLGQYKSKWSKPYSLGKGNLNYKPIPRFFENSNRTFVWWRLDLFSWIKKLVDRLYMRIIYACYAYIKMFMNYFFSCRDWNSYSKWKLCHGHWKTQRWKVHHYQDSCQLL